MPFIKCLKREHYMLICDALPGLVSVTFWRLYDRSNAYECRLTVFLPSCHFHSILLYELAWHSKGSIESQTLECNSNG